MIDGGPARRVMVVYGTRPEAVKLAPVVRALRADPLIEPLVVVTGQHRSMLDQVNEQFGIYPDHDLDIISSQQSLEEITVRTLAGLRPLLLNELPHALLVQGDTTTTFASALAAFYHQVPVVHLEAGLRTGDVTSPFPEEMNRRMVTRLAALHLAPTATSQANLLDEGVDPTTVVTGNTVIDALLSVAAADRPFEDPLLRGIDVDPRRVVLVTTHRRESWGAPMAGVGQALARVARRHPDVLVVLPLHRNPRVRQALLPALESVDNVLVVEPASYPDFVRLMARSTIVVTDSGGVQEEAPSLGSPVLVLRDNTERPEAVAAGTACLVGTDPARVEAAIERLLTDPAAHAAMARASNPYGDGQAAARTVQAIRHLFGYGPLPMPFEAGAPPWLAQPLAVLGS